MDGKRTKRVLLVGNYPPPMGGISVHLKRLAKRLTQQDWDVEVLDMSGVKGRSKPGYVNVQKGRKASIVEIIKSGADIVHIHEIGWRYRAACVMAARIAGARSIITAHSLREGVENPHLLERISVKYVLSRADFVIAVGEKESEGLKALGCDGGKIEVIPAFIPPDGKSGPLPDYLERFLESKKWIICANASSTELYKGVDLYGADMMVALCKRLAKTCEEVGIVYCLSREYITDSANYSRIREQTAGVEASFLFVHESIDFVSLLSRAHIFIRPTNTDGDAVSVREAISLGIPAIVSDVCKRPKGSLLFKSRDLDDLTQKTISVISDYPRFKSSVQAVLLEDNFDRIHGVYCSIGG